MVIHATVLSEPRAETALNARLGAVKYQTNVKNCINIVRMNVNAGNKKQFVTQLQSVLTLNVVRGLAPSNVVRQHASFLTSIISLVLTPRIFST